MEVIAASESWLNGKPEYCLSGLQMLEQWTEECIELHGEGVE
jgi:hypothetical protein